MDISFILLSPRKTKVYLWVQKQKNTTNIHTFFQFFHLDRMCAMKAHFRAAYLDTKVPIKERIYPGCQRYAS